MTHSEVSKRIGLAHLKVGELLVMVEVIDYKNSYGQDRWLVTPTSGSGETFVETGSLVWENN